MSEDAVEPQEVMDQVVEQAEQQPVEVDHEQVEQEVYEKTKVPLSALQKERQKRKEAELELQWERQQRQREIQSSQKPAEEDNSRYESATREDLKMTHEQVLKEVEERMWVRQNPEKYELINEQLPQFLKQRPHLARAIADSPNRYEEAYTLMQALSPKQQEQLRKDSAPQVSPRKDAPNSPGTIPKAAAMNAAVDVMNMSDAEFAQWRASKKRAR